MPTGPLGGSRAIAAPGAILAPYVTGVNITLVVWEK